MRVKLAAVICILISLVAGFVWIASQTSVASLAEDYIDVALKLDEISRGEVDNYFGSYDPGQISETSLDEILIDAGGLKARVDNAREDIGDPRLEGLALKVAHLLRVLDFLADDDSLSFSEELGGFFGIRIDELRPETRLDASGRVVSVERTPTALELAASEAIQELDKLLPGQGSLPFRVSNFQSRFLVPLRQREQLFELALDACEKNTKENWELPLDSGVKINWTREVSAPWHSYLGEGASEISINPLAMGYIGLMIDVACHEGYPGHHAQHVLLEQNLNDVGDLSPEERLMLLRAQKTAVLEGAADYGIGLAFPQDKRLEFERDVLFPLAGLDTSEIESYLRVHHLVKIANAGVTKTIQAYADEKLPSVAAAVRLENDFLVASPRAVLEFVDRYGAYAAIYPISGSTVTEFLNSQAKSKIAYWDGLQELIIEAEKLPEGLISSGTSIDRN